MIASRSAKWPRWWVLFKKQKVKTFFEGFSTSIIGKTYFFGDETKQNWGGRWSKMWKIPAKSKNQRYKIRSSFCLLKNFWNPSFYGKRTKIHDTPLISLFVSENPMLDPLTLERSGVFQLRKPPPLCSSRYMKQKGDFLIRHFRTTENRSNYINNWSF